VEDAGQVQREVGFTLLRQAYEVTEENYDGHVSVPVLWDRFTASVVSNEPGDIVVDVATRFRHLACVATDLYPVALRDRIDELDRRFGAAGARLPDWTAHAERPAGPQAVASPAVAAVRREQHHLVTATDQIHDVRERGSVRSVVFQR